MERFQPDMTWTGIKQAWPRIRLEVWFSRYGQQFGDLYERQADVDPEAWEVIWSFADRVVVVL